MRNAKLFITYAIMSNNANRVFPKYQPVKFTEYLPNECDSATYNYQSIANHSDTATFQVYVNPCDGTTNSIPNPTFDPDESVVPNWEWTVNGGFSLPGSGACKANDSSAASLYKDGLFVIGNAYQLAITIDSLVGSVQVYNGATLLENVTALGETLISFIATAEDLTISFDDTSHYGCIGSVNAYAFSPNMAFGIIDVNGDTAAVADYINNPEYFTFVGNTVTIAFPWSDFNLADDCYSIGFADGCTNTNAQFGIFNQGFCSGDDGWTVDNGTLSGGITFDLDGDPLECVLSADNTAGGVAATGTITSTATQLTIGMCYEITVNDASTSGGGTIRFYCGTAFYDLDLSIGIYPVTFQLTCAGNTTFSIEFQNDAASTTLLYGFQLTLCDQTDYVFDYESQSFKLANNHLCSHLLSFTCYEDALGYIFDGSGFQPNVRLVSRRFDLIPEEIREFYHSNTGTKQVYYGEYREGYNFVTNSLIPGWLMSFFYLARLADEFYIDDEPFFIEGETPQPEWADGMDNFGLIRLQVSEKTQLTRNANIVTNQCSEGSVQLFSCTSLNDIDTGLTETQRTGIFLVEQLRSGQTTSYEIGDDGERQNGRGTSFLQLSCNNWFGNTNRFTATDGTQTLIDSLMLDWQTGLMWIVTPFGTYASWDLAVQAAEAASFAGYTDFYLPNTRELYSLCNFGQNDLMNYSPLSVAATPYANLWSSTTNPQNTAEAYRVQPANGGMVPLAKSTGSVYALFCRKFTRTDLGL